MTKYRTWAVILLILSILGAWFIYSTEMKPDSKYRFKLGLDLSGGTLLVYRADVTKVDAADVDTKMQALQRVIERRINPNGVGESIVQIEKGGVLGGNEQKLIVELPGVSDVDEATKKIGKTTVLEFKIVDEKVAATISPTATTTPANLYVTTGLTGDFLKGAEFQFDQFNQPYVTVTFNDEGQELFAKITRENVGRYLAIFLDGAVISSPVIREEITAGTAQISGGFTRDEATQLVRDLNYGALPLSIDLVGTQKIGASLGEIALKQTVFAGLVALIIIGLFLVLWYRLPGLIATLALCIYVLVMLIIFKLFGVVLTAAGLAGFILSAGMAVDANILIFERMKEEFKRGHDIESGIREGFMRAWYSIRDSNLSSIITALILYWFSSTPLIKGFALIFGVGVLVSMFTAITVSRTFLLAVVPQKHGKASGFLFNNGLKN